MSAKLPWCNWHKKKGFLRQTWDFLWSLRKKMLDSESGILRQPWLPEKNLQNHVRPLTRILWGKPLTTVWPSKMKPLFQGLLRGKKNSWSGKIQVDHDRLHIPSQPAQVLAKKYENPILWDIFLKIHDLSLVFVYAVFIEVPMFPHVLHKHWRPPGPAHFSHGRWATLTTAPGICQEIPTTLKNKKETHPTSKWNQMTFNQKYLSHLVYWAQFFRSFKDIRKPTQANPPSVQRKPRRPQLLRSKGPRGPTPGKTQWQGAKKTKSWKEKGEYVLYLCSFLVGGLPLFLVGVYHLPKGTTTFEMVVDFQGYSQIGSFPQIGAKIKKMLQTTN